jgi:filamentous hemagglutinin
LVESGISTISSTAVQSAVNGDSFSEALKNSLTTTLIMAGANIGAKAIGNLSHYKIDQNTGELINPQINKTQQLLLHGLLGCGAAAAGGGDCASGAVSGITGELSAEFLDKNFTSLSNGTIKELSGLTGGLSAIFTGNAVGLSDKEVASNIFSGQRIGKNAAENNYLTGKIFGKEAEEKIDNLLQNIKGKSLDEIADRYVQSTDPIERVGLFAILTSGNATIPSSATEIEIMIITAGTLKAFSPQIAAGLNKIDEAAGRIFGKGASEIAINSSSTAVLRDGFYEVNGFKFSKYYYEKLWNTGRGAPSLVSQEILKGGANTAVPDAIKTGFYKYSYEGWEMVYNPSTKEVWHLLPTK